MEKLGCTVADKAEVKVDAPVAAAKTYKIGDYYDDGVKQGVVFAVRDNGRHGKIVSLDQEALNPNLLKLFKFPNLPITTHKSPSLPSHYVMKLVISIGKKGG